jgi:tagaturonate epimerase
MKIIDKYSMGLGDRFGHQGIYQLKAIKESAKKGIDITPVWNKSNREHNIIGTSPSDVRTEADNSTLKENWRKPYFVDADHINLDTVDRFIDASDFFTIDVASYIGKKAEKEETEAFVGSNIRYTNGFRIPGTKLELSISKQQLTHIAENYLFAARKAGEIFRHIERKKGKGTFIPEVSMDEVASPQTPVELFFILRMLALENIPLQTIAPKFSGKFNKGVDYSGDPLLFAKEFEDDLSIISYAVEEFGLPGNLKISVHSGSDKFAIYPHIGTIIRKHGKGIHVKTAGTTWLEEVIGLARSGGNGLRFVKEIYSSALEHIDELCAPYSDVIDIRKAELPSSAQVNLWKRDRLVSSLTHIPGNKGYSPDMRQLFHVGYKLAAERSDEFNALIESNNEIIGKGVYENIYERHIKRLFGLD